MHRTRSLVQLKQIPQSTVKFLLFCGLFKISQRQLFLTESHQNLSQLLRGGETDCLALV